MINFDNFDCKDVDGLIEEIINMYSSLEGSNENILNEIEEKISNIYNNFCK